MIYLIALIFSLNSFSEDSLLRGKFKCVVLNSVEDREITVNRHTAQECQDWGTEWKAKWKCETNGQPDECIISHVDLTDQYNAFMAKHQINEATKEAKKMRDCGETVIDMMLVRNQSKTLNKNQVKQLVSSYKDIMALIQTGSLATAKDEIIAVNADGVLVTEADKAALVSVINSCLGL
jgi:hypothetical protein